MPRGGILFLARCAKLRKYYPDRTTQTQRGKSPRVEDDDGEGQSSGTLKVKDLEQVVCVLTKNIQQRTSFLPPPNRTGLFIYFVINQNSELYPVSIPLSPLVIIHLISFIQFAHSCALPSMSPSIDMPCGRACWSSPTAQLKSGGNASIPLLYNETVSLTDLLRHLKCNIRK